MAEQDPRDYRGGVREPGEAEKGNEGVVPREMVDEPDAPPPERDHSQSLSDDSLGKVTDRSDPDEDNIDRSGGDQADATSHSGTGANAGEVREQMQQGEPVPWPQGANIAREDQDPEQNAQAPDQNQQA